MLIEGRTATGEVAAFRVDSAGGIASGGSGTTAKVVGVEFTRPADTTAYAAKDVVSDSASAPTVGTVAGVVSTAGGSGLIVKARLLTDQKTCTAQFRVHLYSTAPTAKNDNDPFTFLYANADKRIGAVDLPACTTEDATNSTAAYASRPSSDGSSGVPNLLFKCASGSTTIYWILETLSAFTPASGQKFYLELSSIPA